MRIVAVTALLVVAVVAGALLLGAGDSDYRLHARFSSAGQLVTGGEVQVAGRKVGEITGIDVTEDGQADVELSIQDGEYAPLHEGTRAGIRAVGQAGVANRFVDLAPGSRRKPELADGAVLPSAQTSGIVDLDAVLNAMDPETRGDIQGLVRSSSRLYAGSGAADWNRMLGKLAPGMRELRAVTGELAYDKNALRRLIRDGATAATALASRRPDLRAAVANSATALGAIASEREALASLLARAPGTLRQASGTLTNAARTVSDLRPTLRDVPPAMPQLSSFLTRVNTVLPRATPVVADLRGQLPPLTRTLTGLDRLEPSAVGALRATGEGLRTARPILRGLRLYGSDFILGIFNGLAGVAAGNFNGFGHYARLEFTQTLQTTLGGVLSPLLRTRPLVPGIIGVRTHLTARCPGGNAPPTPDGSSPWNVGSELCDPSHNMPSSVNEP